MRALRHVAIGMASHELHSCCHQCGGSVRCKACISHKSASPSPLPVGVTYSGALRCRSVSQSTPAEHAHAYGWRAA